MSALLMQAYVIVIAILAFVFTKLTAANPETGNLKPKRGYQRKHSGFKSFWLTAGLHPEERPKNIFVTER